MPKSDMVQAGCGSYCAAESVLRGGFDLSGGQEILDIRACEREKCRKFIDIL
ncbi:hypothetical protein KL86DES1_22019 [uncultured Desulfovibrio sp.]|uniref:Uncharacterized protein n=1 Tax=uncultured Desulfovibrio sp. TaxID=167968 RepID=A0A212LAK2_9BACT|nr:hypothetical protein KL86DES1_22019 [uncultured Desulfovibrio sp.]VZH34911.1 conserved protein of unknown function [Desulfovibrio sp. 86]